MPLLIPLFLGALASAMASLIGRAILAIGMGFVTYTGITIAINTVKQNAISGINSLSSDAIGLIGYLWLDKALTLIFSAFLAAIAMKGISGSIKKVVFK